MKAIAKNNVRIEGHGEETLVFAHGYGCDQSMWKKILPFFRKRYKCVSFDHVGFGQSHITSYDPDTYNSLHTYANDVNNIVSELELKNVTYIGHSVSAMIGILAATKEPDLYSSLILLAPSPCYLNKDEYPGGLDLDVVTKMLESLESNFDDWSEAITKLIMGNPERAELAEELKSSFCRVDHNVMKNFGEVTFLSDHREDLKLSTTPSLIIQCSEDSIAPTEIGKYLKENLKNSEINYLKARGHCPHISEPIETAVVILDFLEKRKKSKQAA